MGEYRSPENIKSRVGFTSVFPYRLTSDEPPGLPTFKDGVEDFGSLDHLRSSEHVNFVFDTKATGRI